MNDSNSIVMNLQAEVSFPRYTNKHEEREDKKRRLVAGLGYSPKKGLIWVARVTFRYEIPS